ncbi:hypothetical protein GCM10010347_63180 [Streptomyces cirratus]|uniref:Uncharacterized protein n=1 Tax=Streptomyces cirratus TaxID=68187 RepID=A0ABQ3F218_9ACTN|nr:hypothetical protein GCM10010347_63180 [Streptomyces cirratus]
MDEITASGGFRRRNLPHDPAPAPVTGSRSDPVTPKRRRPRAPVSNAVERSQRQCATAVFPRLTTSGRGISMLST